MERNLGLLLSLYCLALFCGTPSIVRAQGSTGSLCVTITPPEAVAAGAQWRHKYTTVWRDSGTTETGLTPGWQIIEFKTLSTMARPATVSVMVNADQVSTVSATYLPLECGLSWGTYLGGSYDEEGCGVALDRAGNVYATGRTLLSSWTTGGYDTTPNGYSDAYVVKLSPSGQHLWSTFLGGSKDDIGTAVATDPDGNVCVAGYTRSAGWIQGGMDTTPRGAYTDAAFVAKLSATGQHLWSTYVGGTTGDYSNGIAVDSQGNIDVTGSTSSGGWASGGYNTTYPGGFVVQLSPAGQHRWSTYLGGSGGDSGTAIAVDGSDNIIAVGNTNSQGWVSGGYITTYQGGPSGDGYVVKLSAAGQHLWSTYLGGNDDDETRGVAVDGAGNICVTGQTSSAGWVSGGFDTTYDRSYDTSDGYVVKLSPAGQHLWSTYVGGPNEVYPWAIAANAAGNIYLTGYLSQAPWVRGGFQPDTQGMYDGFVAKLSPMGALLWGSYFGGNNQDFGRAIVADDLGTVYVGGNTKSSGWLTGGYHTTLYGSSDAFIFRVNGYGSLNVSMDPPTAVAEGAMWRRVGTTTWLSPGTTETLVPTGTYQLEFNPLPGWAEPLNRTVKVGDDRATLTSGTYVRFGSLRVTLGPDEAVAAGAMWRRAGTTAWLASGVTEQNVPARDQVIEFKDIDAWGHVPPLPVQINENQLLQTSSTYYRTYGTLVMAIAPPQVVAAGAQWRRAGTTTWHDSATIEAGLPTGTYTVEFKQVPAWNPAPPQDVVIRKDQTTSATAGYIRQSGALAVTLTPPAAVAAGVKWRRVGTTTWHDSATTETGIPTGDYQVEFQGVGSIWLPPAQHDVSIGYLQTARFSAEFIDHRSALLSWSSYFGGTGSEVISGVTMDAAGYLYVTGVTNSANWAAGGYDTTLDGYHDVFVAKLSSDNGAPVWNTYLGGTSWEEGYGITLDREGNLIVGGASRSAGWVSGGYCTTFYTGGTNPFNPFIAKLSPQGGLLWSTYLGTDGGATAVVVDGANNICVTGFTGVNGLPRSYNSLFVKKLSPAGRLIWDDVFAGSYGHGSLGNGIALDGQGNLIVAGSAGPVDWIAGGYDTTFHGGTTDAFLMKLSPAGQQLWSTYLGGAGTDAGNGVAVDRSGAICVTGDTNSAGWVSGGYNTTFTGTSSYYNGFVARLTAEGRPIWSTYLGGSSMDRANAVALDAAGNAYIAGNSTTAGWITGDIQNTWGGMTDAFVVKLSLAGRPLWSTYLGGVWDDYGKGIALDGAGNLGVVGGTNLGYWAAGGYDTHYDQDVSDGSIGSGDGFIAWIHDNGLPSTATSSLCVTLNPSAAVAAGAQWRRVGSDAWHDSGNTETGVPAGPCAIEFKPGAFWVAPADLITTLTAGQALFTSGTYTFGAALKVNIAPPEAAAAGAQWRRAGVLLAHNGGDTEVAVPATSTTLECLAAAGWIAPAPRAVALAAGQLTETTVTCTRSCSLVVSIAPAGARYYLSGWRRVGTTAWHTSGTTETELAAGPCTVEFMTVPNYTPPDPIPVLLKAGEVTSITGTYTRQVGSLQVALTPPEAVADGAQWRRKGTATWLDSGATEASLPTGTYTVEFKSIAAGWAAPTTQSLTVYNNRITTATAAYTGSGTLRVTLSPPGAVAAGAQWRRVGTTAWRDSGTSETAVPAGPYTVEFKPAYGYPTPADQSFILYPNQVVTINGAYVPSGALAVTITPPEAVAAGAKWRRVGTTAWHDSGTTESGLAPGPATVEFLIVDGWIRPDTQTVAITQGQTTKLQAACVRQTGSLYVDFATLHCGTSPGWPWYWRRVGTQTWLTNGAVENGIPTGVYALELLDPKGKVVPAPETATIRFAETTVISITLVGPAAVAGPDWTMY